MAAYAALVSLRNNIEQIMHHSSFSTSFDGKQMASLCEKVEFLLDFIEKYSNREGNEEADNLESRISSAANEAEDVIESHIVDQISAGFTENNPSFLLGLQRILQEMDSIKEKVTETKEERGFNNQQLNYSIPTASSRRTRTKMVGFDEELNQLTDVLTRQSRSRQIVSVAGMGGIGKSTLVRNAYENSLIVHHFAIRAWATVSHQFSVTDVLIDLLSCIEETKVETAEELGEQLYKSLWGRRYLIILDDIWGVEVWDKISLLFPDNDNGSRIVVTTRLSNVAIQCSSVYFRMEFLDEDKSWMLFSDTVFGCEECPPQLEQVAKEISRLCKGLPLSIVVIGGLLRRSGTTVDYWKSVAENISSVLCSEGNEDCLRIVSLSYSQLDVHLKPCFLYMGVFREDVEIRASKIIKLWVAEGFIKPNRSQILEDIAEGYLNDLVDRNLIIVVRHGSNGKVRSCRVHDLIRDLCIRISEKDNFFCTRRALELNKVRRLVLHDFIRSYNDYETLLALGSAQLVRSLMCRGFRMPVVFKLVRVLHMANNSSPVAAMQNLNMRFLSFRDFYSFAVVKLPSSTSLIWNLQTLAIHGAIELVVAPIEIWKMRQLRHVECKKIYLPDPPPNDLADLANLQSLTNAVNLRLSGEVCKRIPFIKKLHLIYDDELKGYDDCLFDDLHNLGSLNKLKTLKVVSPYRSRLCNAERLKWAFPIQLNKLSLTRCSLGWEDLTMIGVLPQLEFLRLDNSVEGRNWSPTNGEFVALKSLSIVRSDLRCWSADSSHFPVLKRLHLERIWHLKEIPLDIGEIPTLEVICVDGCSDSAALSAMKIKEEQESLGYDGLQVQVHKNTSTKKKLMKAVLVCKAANAFNLLLRK